MPRYSQIDALRGAAILFILPMNIVSFALPSAAYLNPAWQGSVGLLDTWVWAILDIFVQLKFLNLFALLFGAGLVFQLPRGARWLNARLGWLIFFGLLHYLFWWEGDILLSYGLIGLLAWRIIAATPFDCTLIKRGIFFYAIGCLALLAFGLLSKPTPGSSWLPGSAEILYESQLKLQGGWLAIADRQSQLLDMLLALLSQYGWEILGLMLIGAALLRNGWLIGQRHRQQYLQHAGLFLIPGYGIALFGTLSQWLTGWDYRWCAFLLQIPREISSPLITLGYIALFHAFWPKLANLAITARLISIGRMAFSEYILQTVLCTAIFSWAGLFMHFTRSELLLIVPAIWAINIIFAMMWLKRFSQGPLEMLWRYLTLKLASKG